MKGHGKSKKDSKFENPCWINKCHHNRDKKKTWKEKYKKEYEK